jgi:DNA-binding MarR family transcriptional regulator
MKPEELTKLGPRRNIYQYVLNYPGLHLRQLARDLGMSYSTIKYHLDYLIKNDLIVQKTESKYLRYYVKDKVGTDEKTLILLLRKKVSREMLVLFLFHLCASQSELSKRIGVHPTTIEYHLKKLLEADIIEHAPIKDGLIPFHEHPRFLKRKPEGNEVIFRLKNPRFIYNSLIKYKKSLSDSKLIEEIIELFDWAISGEQPEIVLSSKYFDDNFIDTFYDIFPHPYHV